jgi:polar amino acid transport system substrate-binding protein
MVIGKYFFLTIWLMVMSIGGVLSKDLTLYTSSSIPPYVIAESDNGIAVDIIRAALAPKGYKVQFLVAPNRRVEKQLTEGKADGAFNLPQKRIVNVFYSQPVLYYDDLAVSLASSHLQINKLEDLAGKKIIGFQNAPKFIGEKFAEIVLNNLAYSEVGDQELQVRMLYAGDRTDVIVLDRNIFLYYFNKQKNPSYPPRSYVFHSIFPRIPIYAAFVDATVRDDFDQGLEALKQSGEYKKIVDAYLTGN